MRFCLFVINATQMLMSETSKKASRNLYTVKAAHDDKG